MTEQSRSPYNKSKPPCCQRRSNVKSFESPKQNLLNPCLFLHGQLNEIPLTLQNTLHNTLGDLNACSFFYFFLALASPCPIPRHTNPNLHEAPAAQMIGKTQNRLIKLLKTSGGTMVKFCQPKWCRFLWKKGPLPRLLPPFFDHCLLLQ